MEEIVGLETRIASLTVQVFSCLGKGMTRDQMEEGVLERSRLETSWGTERTQIQEQVSVLHFLNLW